MPKRIIGKAIAAEAPDKSRPTKAGWRVTEWSGDTGCSRSFTYQLMAAKQIRFVKVGAMTIITTSPAEFLAAQNEGHHQ